MTQATKAVLLSAFVFPGFGHLFLKKHVSCIVLASAAFASLYVVIFHVGEMALQFSGKIQASGAQLDIAAITAFVRQQGTETQGLNRALAVLTVLWLIGIADAYRLGRIADKAKA